jgi:hypothetical protein
LDVEGDADHRGYRVVDKKRKKIRKMEGQRGGKVQGVAKKDLCFFVDRVSDLLLSPFPVEGLQPQGDDDDEDEDRHGQPRPVRHPLPQTPQ